MGTLSSYNDLDKCLPTDNFPPLFLIAGNHDIYFKGWEDFYARYGSSTYYFEIATPVAKDLVVCLDTSGGTLGSDQFDWFEDLLIDKRKDYRHCFVFTHNNLFKERHNTSANPFPEEFQSLARLFTKYKVEVVVVGHEHRHKVSLFGNTLYLQLDAMHDKAEQASYLELTVNADECNYCFFEL
jgi:3',5'-cyclic AMP phosphodiesterase CpdA